MSFHSVMALDECVDLSFTDGHQLKKKAKDRDYCDITSWLVSKHN